MTVISCFGVLIGEECSSVWFLLMRIPVLLRSKETHYSELTSYRKTVTPLFCARAALINTGVETVSCAA
jgi:hypothetical protein